MSGESEAQSVALFLQSAASADKTERRWMAGPRITSDNLKDGTGPIEHCTPAEWFKVGRQPAAAPPRAQPKGSTMGFGKYRDRLLVDVEADDPGYFNWCLREVQGFRARWEAMTP